MKRQFGLCWRGHCGIPILRLDCTPFRVPIFTLQRTDLQQLLVVIDLVLGIEPALADDFIISLEDVDEGCRGSRCASDDSIKEVDFIGGKCCEIGY
jgi:hypothetical protein